MSTFRLVFLLVWCGTRLEASLRRSPMDDDSHFCSRTADCVEKVRRLVAETNRFWFGDSWRLNCGGFAGARLREQNPIKCMNPRELSSFHSLGSRLFHAHTFTAAYLQDLAIFPRMTFTLQPGTYRGCDHDFTVECNRSRVSAHPQMSPLAPFLTRTAPEVGWPELGSNESHVLLLLDAGFGRAHYLVADYPRQPLVLRPYETVDNFRQGQPDPLVLLVFRGSASITESIRNAPLPNDRVFDLTNFMIAHGLERELIGINWALIGTDAYAIERQRLKGSVDNCHSLVQLKLQRDRPFEFVDVFPLSEMDSSLSVSFSQPSRRIDVCCKTVRTEQKDIFVDPLENEQVIPSIAARYPPTVTSMRSIQYETDNYQRSLRHYIALKEDRFTLVMFDPHRHYLHWLIADVPAGALAAGTLRSEGRVLADYVSPVPREYQRCVQPVLMLFRQPRSQLQPSELVQFYGEDHVLRSQHCKGHCVYRSAFDIAQFKSFHRLKLSAVSWFQVCFDYHEAFRRLEHLKTENGTREAPRGRPGTKYVWRPKMDGKDKLQEDLSYLRSKMAEICTAARHGQPHRCDFEPSSASAPSALILCTLIASVLAKLAQFSET